MTAQELNTYIDKVLGNSLRCLLPSYWWRRLLKLIIEYVDGVGEKVESKVDSVESKVDSVVSKVDSVDSKVDSVESKVDSVDSKVDNNSSILNNFFKSTFIVTTNNNGPAEVIADGETVFIDTNSTKFINFNKQFKIKDKFWNIKSIKLNRVSTFLIETMEHMFAEFRNLTSLDLSNFDTYNAVDMSHMFSNCEDLTSLDLSNFDTHNVANMSNMFINCGNLTSLDLSNFDTHNVVDMSFMFVNCGNLTSLDLSNFDTSNVRDYDWENAEDQGMYEMFGNCFRLETLTLGQNFFKVRSVEDFISFTELSNWSAESAISSLVTNSYDRTANGLANITLKLHANTYAYLTDEHKATMEAKGYVIEVA